MLYYCEFKDAIERGFINQDTIMTSRINGQLHDYILEGEPIDLVKHFYTLVLQNAWLGQKVAKFNLELFIKCIYAILFLAFYSSC